MSSLFDLQASIARAVVTGEVDGACADLAGGLDPSRRLAIHARHYETSLTDALTVKFPATGWLIGTAVIRVAARAFVRARPPERPCIAEYGADFPRFLETVLNTRLAYIEAFAALDWAAGQVSIAIALPMLDWAAVVARGAEELIECRLAMQPGLRYLRCDWGVDALMKMYLGGSEPELFVLAPQDACIEVRGSRGSLKLTRLKPAAFVFRHALQRGRSIGEAAESALDCEAEFDPGAELRRVVEAGLASGLHTPDEGGGR